jgi:hypothetical protein
MSAVAGVKKKTVGNVERHLGVGCGESIRVNDRRDR